MLVRITHLKTIFVAGELSERDQVVGVEIERLPLAMLLETAAGREKRREKSVWSLLQG